MSKATSTKKSTATPKAKATATKPAAKTSAKATVSSDINPGLWKQLSVTHSDLGTTTTQGMGVDGVGVVLRVTTSKGGIVVSDTLTTVAGARLVAKTQPINGFYLTRR